MLAGIDEWVRQGNRRMRPRLEKKGKAGTRLSLIVEPQSTFKYCVSITCD